MNQECESAGQASPNAELGDDEPTTNCAQPASATMTLYNPSVEWCPASLDSSLDVSEVLQAAFCRTGGKEQCANLAGELYHAKPFATCKTRNQCKACIIRPVCIILHTHCFLFY